MDTKREAQYKEILKAARDKIRELAEENNALKQHSKAGKSPIAVVGIACEFPGSGDSYLSFKTMLDNGICKVDRIPASRWDNRRYYSPETGEAGKYYCKYGSFLDRNPFAFDNAFFGLGEAEATVMDPQQRLLLYQSWHALEDAGIPPSSLRGSDAGVFLGVSSFDFLMAYSTYELANHSDPYTLTGATFNSTAGRLSYFYDIHGPSMATDTACSSSLSAIFLAMKALRDGECPIALAGGVNLLLSPLSYIALCAIRGISRDGKSRAFGKGAAGFSRGEGSGIVVLKRLEDALEAGDRIHAVILGGSMGHDGQSAGFTAPSGPAQVRIIKKALDNAGVSQDEIAYVETHGTGTELGDQIELSALSSVFGKRDKSLLIGSVKSNIGHLEAAAGVASFIKTVLAVKDGVIPPSLHAETLSPSLNWNSADIEVCSEKRSWPELSEKRIAGVSSFGISGSGAHLVLSEAPKTGVTTTDSPIDINSETKHTAWRVLPISAKHKDSLDELSAEIAGVCADDDHNFHGICDKAGLGRDHFNQRLALVAENSTGAHDTLKAHLAGKRNRALVAGKAKNNVRTAFVFSGQGSQISGMGKELYQTHPAFRATMDRCETVAQEKLGTSLLDIMFEENSELSRTIYTQPAIYAMGAALVELFRAFNIRPAVVIGHSIGEYAAAYAAGVFGLEEGMDIVLERARLADSIDTPGVMAAVLASTDIIEEYLAGTNSDIAAINGNDNIVISGPAAEMSDILKKLSAAGIEYREMPVSHSFHSSMIEPVLDEYRAFLKGRQFGRITIPFISSMQAESLSSSVDWPDYWCSQMRRPVRFSETLATVDNVDSFLEIGASPTLTSLCRGVTENIPWLFSQGPGIPAWKQISLTLAKLYVAGCTVDFGGGVFSRNPGIDCPLYPFHDKVLRPGKDTGVSDDRPGISETVEVTGNETIAASGSGTAAKTTAMQREAMQHLFARQRETLDRLNKKDSAAYD